MLKSFYNIDCLSRVKESKMKLSSVKSTISSTFSALTADFLDAAFEFFSTESGVAIETAEPLIKLTQVVAENVTEPLVTNGFKIPADLLADITESVTSFISNPKTIGIDYEDNNDDTKCSFVCMGLEAVPIHLGNYNIILQYPTSETENAPLMYLQTDDGTITGTPIAGCIIDNIRSFSESSSGSSGVTKISSVCRKICDRATILSIFKSAMSACATAIANSTSLDVTAIASYANNLVGGQALSGETAAMIAEWQECALANPDPSAVAQYTLDMMKTTSPSPITDGFSFRNNNSLVMKRVGTFIASGVIRAASTLVTVAGVAIGGVFGVVLSVAGVLINAITTAVSMATVTPTQVSYLGPMNGLYPYGLFHVDGNIPDLGLANAASDSGYSSGSLPFAQIVCSNGTKHAPGYEIMLRELTVDPTRLKALLTRSSSGVYTFPTHDEVMAAACADHASYVPFRAIYSDIDTLDKAERIGAFISLLYLLVDWLSPTINGYRVSIGQSNGDSVLDALWNVIDYFYYTDNIWDLASRVTWASLSASEGWGDLTTIMEWILSDTWFQRSPNLALWNGSVQWINTMTPLTGYFSWSWDSGCLAAHAIYHSPLPDIVTPTFTRTGIWLGIIGAVAGVVLTATVAFVATNIVKKKIAAFNAKQAAKVESAWSNLTTNPNAENARIYTSTVKKHNFLARFTGGTIFSTSNYWSSVSSDDEEPVKIDTEGIIKLISG